MTRANAGDFMRAKGCAREEKSGRNFAARDSTHLNLMLITFLFSYII